MNGNMRRLAGALLAAAMVTGCGGGAGQGGTPVEAVAEVYVAPALRLNAEFLAGLEAAAAEGAAALNPGVRRAARHAPALFKLPGFGHYEIRVMHDGKTRDGLAHGQGVMTILANGKAAMRYEGGFQAGNLHGRGVLTVHGEGSARGEFSGEWRDGELTGD